MNEKTNNRDYSKRFEIEAGEGFRQVAGSEAYFNQLKNPFTSSRYRVNKGMGNWRWVFFSLAMLAGIVVLLQYTWPKNNREKAQLIVNELPIPEKMEPQPVITSTPVPEPINIQPVQPQKHYRVQPKIKLNGLVDTATAIEPPLIHEPIKPVDTATSPAIALYRYADHRAYYKLRYIEELLTVDYGDSLVRKLKPILTGTSANYEKGFRRTLQKETAPEDPYEIVHQNLYRQKIQKAAKAFSEQDWNKAQELFKVLYKENNEDQNALFYGAVCAYEMGDYNISLIMLEKLGQIGQPVFEQETDYYTALALIKMGHVQKAKEKLQHIVNSDSFYKNRASMVLQELK